MDISYCSASVMEVESQLIVSSAILERVVEARQHDQLVPDVRDRIHEGKVGEFHFRSISVFRFCGRLCLPQKAQVKEDILKEAHGT